MTMTSIDLVILDVDGVLTDGRVTFAAGDEPAKAFYVRDGLAVKRWMKAGGRVAILSGRSERSVELRAKELGIEEVHTGVSDKFRGYEAIKTSMGCGDEAIAYVGDDLPDIPPMRSCGWAVAVANAAPAVKRVAHYVTRCKGGDGAVAEVLELLLGKRRARPSLSGKL